MKLLNYDIYVTTKQKDEYFLNYIVINNAPISAFATMLSYPLSQKQRQELGPIVFIKQFTNCFPFVSSYEFLFVLRISFSACLYPLPISTRLSLQLLWYRTFFIRGNVTLSQCLRNAVDNSNHYNTKISMFIQANLIKLRQTLMRLKDYTTLTTKKMNSNNKN